MQPATHGQQQQQRLAPGMGTGTGPPAPQRRSLLGSTRTEKQQKQTLHAHAHEGLGMGGGSARNGVVIGNTNGFATLGASGSGSTVPQKRKLGFGIGHGNPQGQGQGHGHGGSNKARREDDGGRRREGEGLAGKPHSRAGGAARQGANALGGPPRGAANGGSANADTGDEIRCRCGSSVDDGFSIACDVCGRWCHAACFGIAEGSVPEEWRCWVCAPGDFPALPNAPAPTPNNRRRRASISARRANTVDPAPGASNATANGTNSDTAVEEQLAEDERMQYVLIEDDIVPHANTQRKLRAYAATWRGVSALSPAPTETASLAQGHTPFVFPAPPAAHPTLLQPIVPSSHSSASCIYPFGVGAPSSSTPSVSTSFLPPTFALHTASPAPPRTLLARYPALITPSSAYLAAPTNGYAHAGLPKRFVHLVGPPLDLALDARGSGGRGRWVRSGCWPNAEVRAFVCPSPGEGGRGGRRRGGGDAGGGEGRDGERRGEGEGEGGGGEDECRTHFGIFATRALREGEEIVVGWEWDDANAMHRVGEVAGVNGVGLPSAPTPAQRHLIAQLANILHTLGSSECACTPASSTSTPAAPALPSLPPPSTRPPVSKGRRTTPGSERERSSVSVCPPKMRKRWKGGAADSTPAIQAAALPRIVTQTQMRPPPVPDKGKGKARAQDEAMDVDANVDVEALDEQSG
ncbi:hypothetical protein B0H16DRAFT_511893 [Mycena metata]|uniref:PHD-type domain-containing protein n=1 Tax=Mycena metata TaxID=1033252 RepID=A0AAD7H8Z7_9AGAR|nr:hypothetical protein B0H16DRAFT_511893 [Mycena metata]